MNFIAKYNTSLYFIKSAIINKDDYVYKYSRE